MHDARIGQLSARLETLQEKNESVRVELVELKQRMAAIETRLPSATTASRPAFPSALVTSALAVALLALVGIVSFARIGKGGAQ